MVRGSAARRFLVPMLCLGLLTAGVLPRHASLAAGSTITRVYMASDAACVASRAGHSAPLPQVGFLDGSRTVCLVIVGNLQETDSLTATIYDEKLRTAWQSGPGTVAHRPGHRAQGLRTALFTGIRYGLAWARLWVRGFYRTEILVNGRVVARFTWAVGTVPPIRRIGTGTATPVETAASRPRSTSTPIPPTPATPAPTMTPSQLPSAGAVQVNGAGFTILLPRTWAVGARGNMAAYTSPDSSIELLVLANKVAQKLSDQETRQAIAFAATQADSILKTHLVPSYQPFSIGPLTGLAAEAHIGQSSAGYIIAGVSDNQHAVLAVTLIFPSASPQEIQEASTAVASIRATG